MHEASGPEEQGRRAAGAPGAGRAEASGSGEGASRRLARVVPGRAADDGAGVRLHRVIGTQELPLLDPFLLLDEIRSERTGDYIAGFPCHPHRGFETVTYMLAGRMRHHDDRGNEGLLRAGSVQWMTAGRGIVHSEMPEQEDGLFWGFQLWINLPAAQKAQAPRYQDIPAEDVPELELPGVRVRVLAGNVAGREGPVRDVVARPLLLDVALETGGSFVCEVDPGRSGFAYAAVGTPRIGPAGAWSELAERHLGVLGDGERVELSAGAGPARVLLAAATPLHEPVARYGPFVMNSEQEIVQAIRDFQAGEL